MFSPDIILCGWVGSKYQLTKWLCCEELKFEARKYSSCTNIKRRPIISLQMETLAHSLLFEATLLLRLGFVWNLSCVIWVVVHHLRKQKGREITPQYHKEIKINHKNKAVLLFTFLSVLTHLSVLYYSTFWYMLFIQSGWKYKQNIWPYFLVRNTAKM